MAVRLELHRNNKRLFPGPGSWIRKRQLAKISGPPDPAASAYLCDHKGNTLAWGLYSPDSEICLRVLCAGETPPPPDWLERRLSAAYAARRTLGLASSDSTTGYREVNSEGDGLPGLVVDRYDAVRIVQVTTAPMDCLVPRILEWMHTHLDGQAIVLRPEEAARREGIAAGITPDPPKTLRYREFGLSLQVPGPPAQKTGAYHDQRENRRRFAKLAHSHGGPMLDLGCHVGGFALHAAALGVPCVAVDRSRPALASAAKNAAANNLEIEFVETDMFSPLDAAPLQGPFGSVIFDPPKIATSPRDLSRARNAMLRIVGQLVPRIETAGFLALCSCSHHLDGEQLDLVVRRAAADRGLDFCRIAQWGPGPDHPTALHHPEGEYLRVHVFQSRGALTDHRTALSLR